MQRDQYGRPLFKVGAELDEPLVPLEAVDSSILLRWLKTMETSVDIIRTGTGVCYKAWIFFIKDELQRRGVDCE